MSAAASATLRDFKTSAQKAADETLERIEAAQTVADLEKIRVEALGKKGALSLLLRGMGSMDAAERPEAGQIVNDAKDRVAARLDERRSQWEARESAARLQAEAVDVTLPGVRPRRGHPHPVRQTLEDVSDVLRGMGFRVVAGPEIEDEFHNFEALNIPPDHPARDMQDTFYLKNGLLPRTHTSPVQIRTMLKHKPPLAIACPGAVYRWDADATHSPMFTQIEGLVIDDHSTFGDLKGTIQAFVHKLFGQQVRARFRPSFFPFTEPSAEVDIEWTARRIVDGRVVERKSWLEVLGCGMVHPNVLRNVGLDPEKWQGFAFGLGVERVAMLRYGINDIRHFYENDQRFLRQF
jgi:phenylalanyl-tRNA synthetase alpha chain